MSLKLGRRQLVESLTKSRIVPRAFDSKLRRHGSHVQVFSSFLFTSPGALIHLVVRYDLESNSTQLSKHLTRRASFHPPGGIVRLTLAERIRFRYIRHRALRRKPIPQARAGYSPILRKQLHACYVAISIRPPLPSSTVRMSGTPRSPSIHSSYELKASCSKFPLAPLPKAT